MLRNWGANGAMLFAILAGTTQRQGATQAPSSDPPMVHLFKGEGSRAADPLRALVRDSAGFARLWDQIAGGPAPQVDFNRYMVIAAAMGAQPSTGNTIAVVAIDSSAPALRVRVDLTLWQCPAPAAITYPADIVRVPRRPSTVIFEDRYSVERC